MFNWNCNKYNKIDGSDDWQGMGPQGLATEYREQRGTCREQLTVVFCSDIKVLVARSAPCPVAIYALVTEAELLGPAAAITALAAGDKEDLLRATTLLMLGQTSS